MTVLGSRETVGPSVSDDAFARIASAMDPIGLVHTQAIAVKPGSSVKRIGCVAPDDDGFRHLLQFLSCHPGLCDRQFPEDAAQSYQVVLCHHACVL